MDKGTIIIVEGPRGSGKTPVAKAIEASGFQKYNCLFIPPDLGRYNGFINWDYPEQSYAEIMAVSNMHNFGANIVMDRGIISWCAYNCDRDDASKKLNDWFTVLSKWKCAIIVCLDSDNKNIKLNIDKKGETQDLAYPYKFRQMYDLVPGGIRVYYKVEDYSSNWIFDIECKIMQKSLETNTFHKMRRRRKNIDGKV